MSHNGTVMTNGGAAASANKKSRTLSHSTTSTTSSSTSTTSEPSPGPPPPPYDDPWWCSCLCVRLPRPSQFLSPRWLLACLCLAAIVQGMIFTNVVISSIERRFGLHSTQSGIIAGSYDFGSLLAVIPVTYYGGRPGASKPKYIATGMFVMGTGSLLFASPHFITNRYVGRSSTRLTSFSWHLKKG